MTYESREQSFGKHLISFIVILVVLSLGIGIGTIISHRVVAVGPGGSQLKIQTGGTSAGGTAVVSLSRAFEDVAKRVAPAVVNINTKEVIRANPRRSGQVPDIMRQLIPDQPQEYTQNSLGTGILVDPKGYIITNNHVVQGASKIRVSVKDGKDYDAKVIAGDDLSDIAVIKITGDKDFAAAVIGDSKAMKVGDWVIAIGSPFGLDQTVTAGIISATGRIFSEGSTSMQFNDYLQTDAAINPGNSGGPLVNMNGEVVGINSFISTTRASNAGVGFAVPAHIFVDVYNQILEKGKVSRGYLGVLMNAYFPFTPAMAEYYGVKQGSGVLITSFSDENGPAAKAGIKPEDVVIEFDGKKISEVQDLRLAAANTPPGKQVNVKVVRFGAVKDFNITIAERPPEDTATKQGFSFDEKTDVKPELGMNVANVPPRTARALDISGGALVSSVTVGGLAEDAGIIGEADQAGVFDIIVAANGKKIDVYQDFVDVLKELKSGQAVVLKLLRVGRDQSGGYSKLVGFTSLIKP